MQVQEEIHQQTWREKHNCIFQVLYQLLATSQKWKRVLEEMMQNPAKEAKQWNLFPYTMLHYPFIMNLENLYQGEWRTRYDAIVEQKAKEGIDGHPKLAPWSI